MRLEQCEIRPGKVPVARNILNFHPQLKSHRSLAFAAARKLITFDHGYKMFPAMLIVKHTVDARNRGASEWCEKIWRNGPWRAHSPQSSSITRALCRQAHA